MKKTLLIVASTLMILGCSKSDLEEHHDSLKENFNGRYEIVSATSEIAVDLNMDGNTSNNLLEENTEIFESEISLRIYEDSKIFTEHWPIEYIGVKAEEEIDSTIYNPSYTLDYAKYAITSYFQFGENQDVIELIDPEPILNNGVIDTRFVFPDSIIIEDDDIIAVISTRRLYTFNGYLAVQIVAKYKRYSKLT